MCVLFILSSHNVESIMAKGGGRMSTEEAVGLVFFS
jgi:hypothetical protein